MANDVPKATTLGPPSQDINTVNVRCDNDITTNSAQ